MFRVKKLLYRCLMLLLLLFAMYLLYLSDRGMGKRCTKETSLELLEKLCTMYTANKVDGSLCNEICNSRSFHYEKCFNRGGGKNVMQVMWDNHRVVVKSRSAEFSDYDQLISGALDNDAQKSDRVMTQAVFMSSVRNHIESTFRMKVTFGDEELLDRLLVRLKSEPRELNAVQMNSLWVLLQQEEYLFFMFFKDLPFFPKIYGACGHFYVEEFVPPGAILQPSSSQNIVERFHAATWHQRAATAKGLLDIVKATDDKFKDALHLCDVKPENFGVVDSKVKAIDVDISFFDKTMRDFLQQPNCTKHEDCDFFDCHGVCSLTRKKCTRERRNNNFQAICKDIFQQKLGNPGLLRHPPPRIEEQISQLLQKCIYPDDEERVAKGSTTPTFQRLYELLSASIVL